MSKEIGIGSLIAMTDAFDPAILAQFREMAAQNRAARQAQAAAPAFDALGPVPPHIARMLRERANGNASSLGGGEAGRADDETGPGGGEAGRAPDDDIEAYRASNFKPSDYKRRPVHGGLAWRGEVTVMVAPGGVSKTTYMTTVALAVALGRPLLDILPGPRLPVVMFNAEDCRDEAKLRFAAARKHFRLAANDASDVFVFGTEDCSDCLLTERDPKGRDQLRVRGLEALRRRIEVTGSKLVIIDPLTAVIPYGLNDNGVMAAVMKGLKQIAKALDCAVVLVAHTRKGADADISGAEITAGAGAITNLARGVHTIRRPTEKALKEIGTPFGEEGNIRELIDLKANLKPLEERSYFQLVSVNMLNGTKEYPDPDWVAVASPFTPQPGGRTIPGAAQRAALERLAQGFTDKTHNTLPFSDKPQGLERYYVDEVARAVTGHFPGTGGKALKAAAAATFDEVVQRGWVRVEEVLVGRNKRRGVTVLWTCSPWAADPLPGPFAK